METTRLLAECIVKTPSHEIPKEVGTVAKQAILDCLGVALAGSVSDPGRIGIEFVREMGGQPKAAVFGGGFRTSSLLAALANGTSAHALDYDDSHSSIHGHPSVFLVPAVLALGEEFGMTGREVLDAYVIGLEVAAKVGKGLILNVDFYEKGWHPTAINGTLGATAAAARLLKLDTDQTRMALGIATSLASGSKQNFGTMTKPLHAGNAAKSGVLAAMLARKGFTADMNILESKFGYANLFVENRQYDLAMMTEGLGRPFELADPGLSLKPYPCCRGTHSSLDAMLGFVRSQEIFPEDVESIEVRILPLHSTTLIHANPRTGYEGKFSMQFCMAIALRLKKVGVREFTDENVLAPATQDLMKKVKMIPDQALNEVKKTLRAGASPVVVTIRTKDGRDYVQKVDYPKGHPDVPLSREEILDKFRDCAEIVLPKEAIERAIGMIDNLEGLKDLKALAELLKGGLS